jgi:DNA integrity scanning protein DisA with diadenylate cyclase activity
VALVVSEETGEISYLKNGEFVFYKDLASLASLLKEDLI